MAYKVAAVTPVTYLREKVEVVSYETDESEQSSSQERNCESLKKMPLSLTPVKPMKKGRVPLP